MVIENVAKGAIYEKKFVDETPLAISKLTGWKYRIRRDSTCTTKNKLYI